MLHSKKNTRSLFRDGTWKSQKGVVIISSKKVESCQLQIKVLFNRHWKVTVLEKIVYDSKLDS